MKNKNKENEIIDNLLTGMTIIIMMNSKEHLDAVQNKMINHPYIKDALLFLKNNGGAKTMANEDWIKKLK